MQRSRARDESRPDLDVDPLVVEFQRTGDERALEALLRWATPRITLRVDRVAPCTQVARDDLEDEAAKVLRSALRSFDPEGSVGFAPFYDRRLKWAVFRAAAGGGRGLVGESRHTETDRRLVLRAHKFVSAREASRRGQLRRLGRPPALIVPPVELALSDAAAAASSYAARRTFYRALPSILDALATYLRRACEAAGVPRSADAVARLAAWCVVEALTPALRDAADADVAGEARPAPPSGGRPGAFARGLGETAQSAWTRYYVWGDLAVTHPMREFWARVADVSGVSSPQAQLLHATQGNVESLDAARPGRSKHAVGPADRPWADLLAAPGRSDAGLDADEDADARLARVAQAEALYGQVPTYERLLLAATYGLKPLGRFAGMPPDRLRDFVAMLQVTRAERARALAVGERTLGPFLWVLVAEADGPRTVWRRHPALRVLRRAKMRVAEWVAARAPRGDEAGPPRYQGDDLARAQFRTVDSALDGASGRRVDPAPIVDARAAAAYAVTAGDVTCALRRVGLGALGRGRRAAQNPDGRGPAATLSISVAGASPAAPSGPTGPSLSTTAWLTLSVIHRAREVSVHTRLAGRPVEDGEAPSDDSARPACAPGAGDAQAESCVRPVGGTPRGGAAGGIDCDGRPAAFLGRADARAFAAALRGVPATTVVHVSGCRGALSVATDRARVVLPPPRERRARVRHDAPSPGNVAAPSGTAVSGARVRASSLIRAALRVAPVTAFASEGDRPRRGAWGRADAVAAFANGCVIAAVSSGDLLAYTEFIEGVNDAPVALAEPGGTGSDRGWSARVPGRVLASLPDVFPPGERLRIARVGDVLCIDGNETWIRVPAQVPLLADWRPRLTNESPLRGGEVGGLVRTLSGLTRNSGHRIGDVRCVWPSAPVRADRSGEPAPVESGLVVSTTALLAALAAVPTSSIVVSTATVQIPRGRHTHEYPAVVLRPLWPARAVPIVAAATTPADHPCGSGLGWEGTWIAVAGAAPTEELYEPANLPTVVL